MSVWKSFVEDNRLFPIVSERIEGWVLRSMIEIRIKWFPNPSLAKLTLGNLVPIVMITESGNVDSASINEPVLQAAEQRVMKFTQPPSLDEVLRFYPSMMAPLKKIIGKFGDGLYIVFYKIYFHVSLKRAV